MTVVRSRWLTPRLEERRLHVVAVGAATLLAAAATVPAIGWEPLHPDEAIMLEFSRDSLPSIVKDVFVDRGGAPAQFFVEHMTLGWPGGIVGLRAPSLLFFLLSLPLAAALARRLFGERERLLLPFMLALAPLAVGLATFARMYALFLLAVLGVTWLGLRAAEQRDPRWWRGAGAAAGLLVYVHPIAPLYAPLALLTGLAVRPSWRPSFRELRPALIAAAAVAVPYAYALAVLGSRYHVGEASRVRTTAGRSVPLESLYALTPGGTAGLVLFGTLALIGLVWSARRRPPVAVALAAWLVVPITFFTLVPAQTRFFDRYLLPALPAFLLLVLAGCVAVASLARAPVAVAALIVLALVLIVCEPCTRSTCPRCQRPCSEATFSSRPRAHPSATGRLSCSTTTLRCARRLLRASRNCRRSTRVTRAGWCRRAGPTSISSCEAAPRPHGACGSCVAGRAASTRRSDACHRRSRPIESP